MALSDRCPRCGALVLPDENYCQQCGTPLNEDKSAASTLDSARNRQAGLEGPGGEALPAEGSGAAQTASTYQGGVPRTIEELQAFCAHNEMPLERMRFFIGINYRQPRAFGIYRDGDNVVVYKNKDDGSRAVRYHGPDEAYAVKELYDKLLDECHKRNIWPGGKPKEVVEAQRKSKRRTLLIVGLIVALIVVFWVVAGISYARQHRHDGYYRFGDSEPYYRYGDSWYYYNDYDWYPTYSTPYYGSYEDYYIGGEYDRSWGGSDFKSSSAWEDLHESEHTSSSDYDSWDSSDTDWSSDW